MKTNDAVIQKTRLLSGAAVAALSLSILATPAYAQDEIENCVDADGDGQCDNVLAGTRTASASEGVITVTGSRIARNPEVAGANPVVTIDAESIQRSGETNLTEILKDTPALFNSEDSFDASGSEARFGGAGVNVLNLRNLGANRTLVLVDGRRHVAGLSGEGAVDINSIPIALVERVDVLTGGVSSVYGADGVSGVVNFIMNRDFQGIEVRGQNGISKYGDAESYYGSIAGGHNFAGGRGNISGAYEFRKDGRVTSADRPEGRFDAFLLVRNPDDIPDDPAIFDFIPRQFIGYADSAPGGALVIDSSFVAEFYGTGRPYRSSEFLPNSGFLSAGDANADDTPVASYQGDLQAATEHHSFNIFTNYEITPSIRFFAEGKYVKSDNFTVSQPSFDFFTYVSNDNPLIPQNVRDAVDARGDFGGVLVNRDNFDLGTRNETIKRDLYRGVVGFDGEITPNARFEVSYVYGRNKSDFILENYRVADRYFAALDAVDEGEFLNGTPNGNIVCRSSIDGSGIVDDGNFNYGETFQTFTPGQCVPLNIFGPGMASQAALDFINVDLNNSYSITQQVVNGYISGDSGAVFELPGGPVGFVLGAEYRKEKSVALFDPISKQTATFDPNVGVLADLALLDDEVGSYDVYEGFAELSLPILADLPFAEILEATAAIRLSDYSTSGYSESWSVSGIYAPVRDIRFRGSYSKAARAANITELFAPATGTFSFITDPCDPANVTSGAPVRAANCRALIEGLGADYDTYDYGSSIDSSASIPGNFSGNPGLEPEEATTWTAGVVLQPRFVPGLALSFDWYDIKLEQAINTTTLTELAEFCVDSPTLDNQFCDLVTRAPGTGYVVDFSLSPVNVAFFETAGADMTLSYRTDVGGGNRIEARGTLGYLDKLAFIPADGGTLDDDRGELGAPKWSGNADITFVSDSFSLNYGVQYVGSQLRYEKDVLAANPDRAAPEFITIGSRFIHDARAEFRGSNDRSSFFIGVNNFTNERPALGQRDTPTGWRGRYYYAGFRVSFDRLPRF